MKNCSRQLAFIILIITNSFSVAGQSSIVQSADTQFVQIDVSDLIRKALHKPPKNKPESAGSFLLVPIIGSNLATGFMYGVGGQYSFKMSGITSYSNLVGSLQGTTKNQLLFLLKNNIYTWNNSVFLTGDWRYLKYSQSTYGLGTTSPERGILDYKYGLSGIETNNDTLAQPMRFNFLRFHPSFGYKIANGLYAGLCYDYDGFSKIVDEKLRLEPGDTFLTNHYYHNTHC